jgi:hypothetical protein
MKKVIVNIMGGLGNQFFQYATARRVALQNRAALKLDIRSFEKDELRNYSLEYFNIQATTASQKEISKIKLQASDYRSRTLRLLQHLKPYHKRRIYQNQVWSYDDQVLNATAPIYLDGYWANPRFFEDIRFQLTSDFILKTKYVSPAYHSVLKKVKTEGQWTAIHIRRGDYLSTTNKNIFSLLPLDYYKMAWEEVRKKTGSKKAIIFSDDPEWSKQKLQLKDEYLFAADYLDKDYLEFSLMRNCHHHIIANSTFSWWAAWLNDFQQKVVIAPKVWYKNAKAQTYYNNSSFIPASWIRI